MASRIPKQVFHSIKTRNYGSMANVMKTFDMLSANPKSVSILAVDRDSPYASVAVVVKAGSRCETANTIGVSHLLRHLTDVSTRNVYKQSITRGMERDAAAFSIFNTRDYLVYSLNTQKGRMTVPLDIVRELTTPFVLRKWEFSESDAPNKMAYDNQVVSQEPTIVLQEALHSAAFKGGLDHSVYCPSHLVGKHSVQQVMSFMESNFGNGRVSIIGMGVSHDALLEAGLEYELDMPTNIQDQPCAYVGGQERRVETPCSEAYVALAAEGPKHGSSDYAAAGVLEHLMGVGSHIKYSGNEFTNRLGQVSNAVAQGKANATALNKSYSDTGLFGFTAVSDPTTIDQVIKNCMNEFKKVAKGDISDEELGRAKNQYKMKLASLLECPAACVLDMAPQLVSVGVNQQAAQDYLNRINNVDSITKQDVSKFAQKVVSGKFSMAAYGNLANVPRIGDLS